MIGKKLRDTFKNNPNAIQYISITNDGHVPLWVRVSIHGPSCHWTIHYPPASVSWELGLQECTSINHERYFKNKRFLKKSNKSASISVSETWQSLKLECYWWKIIWKCIYRTSNTNTEPLGLICRKSLYQNNLHQTKWAEITEKVKRFSQQYTFNINECSSQIKKT